MFVDSYSLFSILSYAFYKVFYFDFFTKYWKVLVMITQKFE